ncbi:MAG: hypothetical protein J0I18_21110 [Actinobacteria bacterium]|nr:hypothetical protein [Actinomycetota bacterium]
MSTIVAPHRPPLSGRRRSALLLSAAAVAAVAGVALLPWRVADVWSQGSGVNSTTLSAHLNAAFVGYWNSGASGLGADLSHVVTYWQVFHITKAVAAAVLLTLLVLLGVRLWQLFARSERPGARAAYATLGVLGAPLAPMVLLILLANIQGAVAPLSSVLSFLDHGGSDPAVAQSLAQIGEALRTGAVLAVAATVTGIAIIGTSIALLVIRSRRPRDQRRARAVLAVVAVTIPALAFCFAVLALANFSTTEDTVPALTAFFGGDDL